MLFLELGFAGKAFSKANNEYEYAVYRAKMDADPVYAEKERKKNRESQNKYYSEHPEVHRVNPKRRHEDHRKQLWSRREKNGFSKEVFETILSQQEGRCAICSVMLAVGKKSTNAHADHNHTTGKPRAILCGMCNVGLGHFQDNPALLRKAADYVESYLPLEFAPWLGESQPRGLECLDYLSGKESLT